MSKTRPPTRFIKPSLLHGIAKELAEQELRDCVLELAKQYPGFCDVTIENGFVRAFYCDKRTTVRNALEVRISGADSRVPYRYVEILSAFHREVLAPFCDMFGRPQFQFNVRREDGGIKTKDHW